MNSDDVPMLKRCLVCRRSHVRSGETCSRECRMMKAEFTEFYTLRLMLSLSRWTGGRSQEQLRVQYYAQQIRDGVRQLPLSSDPLAEALIEILAELPAEAPGSSL
jgi:hypothetical protein